MKIHWIVALALCCSAVYAQEEKKESKFHVKFGGRIDAYVYTDTYRGVESGGGLQYQLPARPVINASGEDLNAEGSLRFGIASSRLNVMGTYDFTPKFKASGFVEVDFMGTGSIINLPRLRHAFVSLDWAEDRLLIGQTSHLLQVDEIAPPTVLFGSGYPFAPLSRPIQVQYTHRFGELFRLSGGVSMFYGQEGPMQSRAMTPDVAVRFTVGSSAKWLVGAGVSFKSIMPQLAVVEDPNARLNAFSGAVFGMVRPISWLAIRAYLFAGQDPQTLGLTGMFAPMVGGLGYAPNLTGSGYVDFEAKLPEGFSVGLFGGYQQNFGTWDPIITAQVWTGGEAAGLDSFFRIAPRVWYSYRGKLEFGLEYLYNQSSWAGTFDRYYLPETLLPAAVDHRVMLLARFNF